MKYHGQIAMRSARGGLIMPLRSAYDRELVFELLVSRVMRDRWVDVSAGGEHWRAMLVEPEAQLSCTRCGAALRIAHASAGHRLCTQCRIGALH